MNILWIQCDEIRADSLSCYEGNPWVRPQTPNVQRLADSGVVFDNAFCPSPVCMPSRGCECTSQYATSLGVFHNVTRRHRETYRFDTHWTTWPRLLRDAGYLAVNVGKLHIVGYDVWDEHTDCPQFPRMDGAGRTVPPECREVRVPGIPRLIVGGTYPRDGQGSGGFGAGRLTGIALRRLAALQASDRPWLLRVSYVAPHTPVLAPRPFDALYPEEPFTAAPEANRPHEGMSAYERAVARLQAGAGLDPSALARARSTYYGLVAAIDREIGRLLDAVPEDTAILLTGDHGAMLGEMGLWQKQVFHHAVHRVPYVFRAPGLGRGRRTELVDLLDTGPTLLGLCGLPVPAEFQGRDLFSPALQDKDLYSAFGYGDPGAYLYEALEAGPDWPRRVCLRSGPYRLDLSIRRQGRRLEGEEQDAFFCDTREDPREWTNAASDPRYADVAPALRERLLHWHDTTVREASV
ncbi:MAG: sulfatase-like hydrolase/transferase [Lentisphaeria bacterium]|nr:sulfatase-like hydrolase/transferase [Lentisphaeria bacterium]